MLIAAALVFAASGQFSGSVGRTWVYLKDKGLHSAELAQAIDALKDSYPDAAIQRRLARRTAIGLFDERDLPVADTYLRQIEAAGAHVHVASRWLNAVSVEGDISTLAGLPFVQRMEKVREGRRRDDGLEQSLETVFPDLPQPGPARDYGLSADQLNQIHVPALHTRGYTGRGVIVGILDTGFVTSHVAFHQPGHELVVVAAHDFVSHDENVGIEAGDAPGQHWHGTAILGCIASYFNGAIIGGAFDAHFVLCKTEDVSQEVPVEEDNYVAGLEFAEMHGADVVTSSLGYIDWYTQAQLNGVTAVTSIGVNVATENGVVCCTAAGNSGHDADPATSHLIAPADALKVLTCGAVDANGDIAGFSSDGPTADGRVKPELLARGVSTFTINPDNSTGYGTASGTSLSTPLLASAMACLVQARPWWSVDRIRAATMATAGDCVANQHADPLGVRGYGILNVEAATDFWCVADYNGDGVRDFFDYLDFVEAFSRGVRGADFNGDAVIDFFDYLDFVAAFTSGC